MAEVCKLILGNRGSGKSVGLQVDLLNVANEGDYAVVCFDRPGTLAHQMIGHLAGDGHLKRTYIEYARETDRVLSWPFARPSQHPDPLQRRRQDDLAIEELCQAFYARRNEKGGEAKPYTDRYLKAALAVWMSQPVKRPVLWTLKLFQSGTPEHEVMMREARDREAVLTFERIEEIGRRNPVQYAIETGASERILQPVQSPAVWTRDGNSIDWTTLLEEKAQVYFDLSDVTADAARTLTILAYTAIILACRRYHDKYQKPLKVIIVLEEAGAMDLVTPVIITAMQELRKAGVFVWIISQTMLDFKDQNQFEQLMALSDTHIYYRMNSGLERAALDIATPQFDPHSVHYERERIIQDGYEEIPTFSSGKSSDSNGNERTDERAGVSFRAIYRPIVDQFFKNYQLQEDEVRKDIATFVAGQRYVRDLQGVRKETVQMIDPPFSMGLTPLRTKRAIQEIRSRPCYQPPMIIEPPPAAPRKGKGGMK